MHSMKIHKVMAMIVALFHLTGFWHLGDQPTAREFRTKLFYCICHLCFVMAFAVGAIKNEKSDQTIFLTELSFTVAVCTIKLWIVTWEQNKVKMLLSRLCEFSIRNDEDVSPFNEKIRKFSEFVFAYSLVVFVGSFVAVVAIPFLGDEKTLFYEIGFPLDWRNSDIAFWIASVFMIFSNWISILATFFSILIWYLLLTCSLRYKILAREFKSMGRNSVEKANMVTIAVMKKHFHEDLKASVNGYAHLRELTDELGSFCADLFFIQFATSGLCICGSIYCLAFDIGETPLERLIYFILFIYVVADLFMITYFGNEIMLASNRLSYSLFESDWCDQPQATKKCMLIFGEYLQQPHQLIVGKLYSLTLETFTKILNSAYSMFNILKSFKE